MNETKYSNWTGDEPDWACVVRHKGVNEQWIIFEGDYQPNDDVIVKRLEKLKPVLDLVPPTHNNSEQTRWHFTKDVYEAIVRGG